MDASAAIARLQMENNQLRADLAARTAAGEREKIIVKTAQAKSLEFCE